MFFSDYEFLVYWKLYRKLRELSKDDIFMGNQKYTPYYALLSHIILKTLKFNDIMQIFWYLYVLIHLLFFRINNMIKILFDLG